MKKSMRILSALLVFITLFSTIACSDTSKPTTEKETTASQNGGETTPDSEDVTTELQPDIPSDLDFKGESFVFLTSGSADTNGVDWETYDIWVEGMTGDVINDAVYDRNLYINETYNVNIEQVKSTGTVYDQAQTSILAQADEYDAIMAQIQASATMAQNGYTYNLYDVPHINLSQPWWDQRGVADLSIGGRLNFATGDITVIDNDATWVLMFNKQLHTDLALEDIYDLIRNNKWTYDKLYEMIQAGTRDLNGDGKMNYAADQYGFCTTDDSAQGLLYASGVTIVSKDENDLPTAAINADKVSSVIDFAAKIMSDAQITLTAGKAGISTDRLRQVFEEGNALFFGEVMQCIIRMRASTTDFGLITWPKFDENQKDYHNFVHATAAKAVNIPKTQPNSEMAGAIIEAMAAKSMYTLTPAYYDVALTYKYMRDEESAEMLSIILESRTYDLGYVFDWGSIYTSIRSNIISGKNTFASSYAKLEKSFVKLMDKTVEAFEKNS